MSIAVAAVGDLSAETVIVATSRVARAGDAEAAPPVVRTAVSGAISDEVVGEDVPQVKDQQPWEDS